MQRNQAKSGIIRPNQVSMGIYRVPMGRVELPIGQGRTPTTLPYGYYRGGEWVASPPHGQGMSMSTSFIGSNCFIQQYYQDSIVIITQASYLIFFITLIANPNQDKIRRELLPSQGLIDYPNLVAYIFYIKKQYLL